MFSRTSGRHLRAIRGMWGDLFKASGRHLEDIHRRFSPLAKWMSVGTLLGWMWQRVFLCMSRNKLKKAQSYLETCLVRVSLRSVFKKPQGNIFDDFRVNFWSDLVPTQCQLSSQKPSKNGHNRLIRYFFKNTIYRIIRDKLDKTKQLFQTENNQWGSKMWFVHDL